MGALEEQSGAMAFRFWQAQKRPVAHPVGIVAHIDAIVRAADIETVWALLCRFIESYGFSGVIYGYSPNSRGPSLGAREDFLLLSTLGQDFMRTLVDQRIFRESITFNWALRNAGVASWSMTAQDAGVEEFVASPAALEFFERYGMGSGCTIGFPTASTRGRAVMALIAPTGATQDQVDATLVRFSDALFVVATVAHRSLITMPYLGADRSLTRRQREVLEWVAEGKSVADIARILNLAQPTVEKHLKLARETLGVETTAHALIKAAFLNQMFALHPSEQHRRN